MKRFITLLKYLDRTKATPEAVLEIASLLGRSPTAEQAAEVANAFRTRGIAGLTVLIPDIMSWPHNDQSTSSVKQCPNCGMLINCEV